MRIQHSLLLLMFLVGGPASAQDQSSAVGFDAGTGKVTISVDDQRVATRSAARR